jgi:predicted Zn-dependent peptidase
VAASYAAEKGFGRVGCYVGTTPEKAQQSLDVMFGELKKLAGQGAVEREEFDRALVGARTRLVFAGESMGARAGAMASDYYRLGRARTLDELAAEMQRITLDDVNAYVQRRALGSVTVVTLGSAPLVVPG